MSHDIKNYVLQCEACNELQPNLTKEPMMFHSVPKRPWCKVAVDMFTLYNHDYFIIVDFFSDYWELDELNSATSANIICICKRHFARYGIPDKLISDIAAVFTGSEFATFAKTWEFRPLFPLLTTVDRMARQKIQSKLPNDY